MPDMILCLILGELVLSLAALIVIVKVSVDIYKMRKEKN